MDHPQVRAPAFHTLIVLQHGHVRPITGDHGAGRQRLVQQRGDSRLLALAHRLGQVG